MRPFTEWLDIVEFIQTVNGECSIYLEMTLSGGRSVFVYHHPQPPTTRKGPARRIIPFAPRRGHGGWIDLPAET